MDVGDTAILIALVLIAVGGLRSGSLTHSSLATLKESVNALEASLHATAPPAAPAEPAAPPLSMATSPVIREAMADPVFRSEMRSAGRELLRKRLAEKAKKA